MYYYAHLRLGKYGTLLESRATAVEKAIKLARLIVKYDRSHVFGHLLYVIKKLTNYFAFSEPTQTHQGKARRAGNS